jgi:hypothetical protein
MSPQSITKQLNAGDWLITTEGQEITACRHRIGGPAKVTKWRDGDGNIFWRLVCGDFTGSATEDDLKQWQPAAPRDCWVLRRMERAGQYAPPEKDELMTKERDPQPTSPIREKG